MSFSSYFTQKSGGDRIFAVEAPKIKFGRGSLQEMMPRHSVWPGWQFSLTGVV